MMTKKRITAAELMLSLSNDQSYKAKREKEEQERKQKLDLLEKEYVSFSKDCAELGHLIKTAWDLVQTAKPYPDLIPVLIKYLEEENHSAKFREGIARALATADSFIYFDKILEQYIKTGSQQNEVRWAIGCALAQAAQDQETLNKIEVILFDKKYGRDRAPLIQAIKRMQKKQRMKVIEMAAGDDELKNAIKTFKIK